MKQGLPPPILGVFLEPTSHLQTQILHFHPTPQHPVLVSKVDKPGKAAAFFPSVGYVNMTLILVTKANHSS